MATKEPNNQEERPTRAPRPPYVKEYMEGKLLLVTAVFIVAFLLLFVRLVYLAVWKNDEYIKNVNNNYGYQTTTIPAPRGKILDRNGDVLATSNAEYVLVIEPKAIMEQEYYRIAALMVYKNVLGFDSEVLDERLAEIEKVCEEKENLVGELSDEKKAIYNRRWYWRYPEFENENRTVIDGEVMRDVQTLAEQLRSTKRADKIAALRTLFKVTDEQITGIQADVEEQRAAIKKSKGNILTRIGDLITGATREVKTIDYAEIAKKWSVDELTAKGIGYMSVLRIVGIRFETEYERVYPYETLACKILGFYSPYFPESSMGLERSYDSSLSGTDGVRKTYMTEDLNRDATNIEPQQGNTLVTGIDIHIQSIIEKNIKQFADEIGAENIAVVCMNPQNGTIVAMADDRIYDPNKHDDMASYYTQEQLDEMWQKILKEDKSMQKKLLGATPEEQKTLQTSGILNYVYRNYCLSNTYEPGSAFKPLTVAMGYELGKVNENTLFVCDGFTDFSGTKVRCHNRDGCGELNLAGALANSCNDYLMYVSSLVGRDNFFDYRCRFNIGSKTGVDLPGEVSAENLNFTADQLNPLELATSSFGQGFNTTMMQMAAALCTTINGGYYYVPHVVTEERSADGQVVARPYSTPVTQVISKKTSDFLREAMYEVVEEGTASYVKIAGYEIGGKTGTAQKGNYAENNYVISLASFIPVSEPDLFLYVVIDQPHLDEQNSSKWAQLVSKRIWMEIIPYLNLHSKEEGIDYLLPNESGEDPDPPPVDGYDPEGFITVDENGEQLHRLDGEPVTPGQPAEQPGPQPAQPDPQPAQPDTPVIIDDERDE